MDIDKRDGHAESEFKIKGQADLERRKSKWEDKANDVRIDPVRYSFYGADSIVLYFNRPRTRAKWSSRRGKTN